MKKYYIFVFLFLLTLFDILSASANKEKSFVLTKMEELIN